MNARHWSRQRLHQNEAPKTRGQPWTSAGLPSKPLAVWTLMGLIWRNSGYKTLGTKSQGLGIRESSERCLTAQRLYVYVATPAYAFTVWFYRERYVRCSSSLILITCATWFCLHRLQLLPLLLLDPAGRLRALTANTYQQIRRRAEVSVAAAPEGLGRTTSDGMMLWGQARVKLGTVKAKLEDGSIMPSTLSL